MVRGLGVLGISSPGCAGAPSDTSSSGRRRCAGADRGPWQSLNPSEMAETQFYKDELLKCFSKENRKTKLFVYAKDTEGAEHKRKAGTVGKLIDNLSK